MNKNSKSYRILVVSAILLSFLGKSAKANTTIPSNNDLADPMWTADPITSKPSSLNPMLWTVVPGGDHQSSNNEPQWTLVRTQEEKESQPTAPQIANSSNNTSEFKAPYAVNSSKQTIKGGLTAKSPNTGVQREYRGQNDAIYRGNAGASANASRTPLSTQPEKNNLVKKDSFPVATDYQNRLNLASFMETANQLEGKHAYFDFYQQAPLAGGGQAGGTGNQNYTVKAYYAFSDKFTVGGFYSEADDPLWALIPSKITASGNNPANFWQSFGGLAKYQLYNHGKLGLSALGSLEQWNVGSGGCDSWGCKGNDYASANIFNDSGKRVFTKNIIGSINIPATYSFNDSTQFTLSTGVSLLPSSQGEGQGGAGNFYGSNFNVAAGLSWKLSPQLSIPMAGLIPLGPGYNSFNSNLQYERVPIYSIGTAYSLNPRVSLEVDVTNSFGGTPATAILAQPSQNQPNLLAKFSWNPTAKDSPALPYNERTRSLTMGGLTVDTALVPPAGIFNVWANADGNGSVFGAVDWSISNDFQIIAFHDGAFNSVSPITPYTQPYMSSGGFNQRLGGKAVFMQQLRGAPITWAGEITVGRNYDQHSYEGYMFVEGIHTWIANNALSLNVNPKLAWSGTGTPVAVGFSANLKLLKSLQLIPEANLVATGWSSSSSGSQSFSNGISQSNGTIDLRWLPFKNTGLDVYVSNATGIYDMGQFFRSSKPIVGTKLTVQF